MTVLNLWDTHFESENMEGNYVLEKNFPYTTLLQLYQ